MDALPTSERICFYCSRPIRAGRSDKKFCNQDCKDRYHHAERLQERKEIMEIESKLKRNRKILQQLFEKYRDKPVSRTVFQKAGFDFDYLTHFIVTKLKSNRYHCCFNYGYREFEPGKYYVIRLHASVLPAMDDR